MALTTKFPRSAEQFACLPFTDYCETLSLAAGVAESVTVPAGATVAVFSADCNIVVKNDATAVVIADTTDGTGGVLNPSARIVKGVTILSIISPTGGNVSVEFFMAPS